MTGTDTTSLKLGAKRTSIRISILDFKDSTWVESDIREWGDSDMVISHSNEPKIFLETFSPIAMMMNLDSCLVIDSKRNKNKMEMEMELIEVEDPSEEDSMMISLEMIHSLIEVA